MLYQYQPKGSERVYEIETDQIPAGALHALLVRSIRHALQNEASSPNPIGEETAEEREANLHVWRTNWIEKVYADQLGVREGGPRKDPIESEAWDLAEKDLKVQIRKLTGKTLPSKASDMVVFAGGETIERKELLGRFFATNQAKYMDQARRNNARRERDAANGPKEATSVADFLSSPVPATK